MGPVYGVFNALLLRTLSQSLLLNEKVLPQNDTPPKPQQFDCGFDGVIFFARSAQKLYYILHSHGFQLRHVLPFEFKRGMHISLQGDPGGGMSEDLA